VLRIKFCGGRQFSASKSPTSCSCKPLVASLKIDNMDKHELIWEYQRTIIDVYKTEGLTSLKGLDESYTINGRQILTWHSEATRKCKIKFNGQFNYFENFDDLLFCSDELLYFTAHLFLYRPFINDPAEEGFPAFGKIIYPNYQNLEAKRYGMFADIASQKAYNYWDRIGDIIASFFPNILKPNNIFFPKVIEAIPVEFQQSENYKWLKEFKENDYLELNKKRKRIVHYTTSDTDFKHKHLEKVYDKEAMKNLQAERVFLADFYKNQISLTLTGLEKTLLFFDEINPILFPDIPNQ
jgi:hypothetical protein